MAIVDVEELVDFVFTSLESFTDRISIIEFIELVIIQKRSAAS
jgi:hypothetical protein